jgi:transcriptional regulator
MSENSEETKKSLFHFPHYTETDQDKILSVISSTVLGNIITSSSEYGLQCNQIPFTLHRDDKVKNGATLKCHFPIENQKQLRSILNTLSPDNKDQVLITFNGPNHYISANWFPTKKLTHRFVPTWNYVTINTLVKVKKITTTSRDLQQDYPTLNKGDDNVVEHQTFMKNHLTFLTNQCENMVQEEQPWSLSDAPEPFLKQLYNSLVGIEFEIISLEGKVKTSQDKPTEQAGVIAGLENVAKMQQNDPHFPTNHTSQCPLAMRSLVKDNGLPNIGTKPSAVTVGGGDRCATGSGCPVTALGSQIFASHTLIIAAVAMGIGYLLAN